MTAEHDHDHGAAASAGTDTSSRRRLRIALALTGSFMFVEIAAGLASGSLALLSDAGHMLTDAGSLVLALWAQAISSRPRSAQKTFGYKRAEVLAAAANGIVLGAASIAVVVEAVRRFSTPEPIKGGLMFVVAAVGLGVNMFSAWILSRGGGHNLNLRAAAAHMLADAAGAVAALVAAVLILAKGWTIADPITSIVISMLIFFGSWRLLRDATNVLMEGVPAGIDVAALERVARETAGVSDVHDLHVWSLVGTAPVVTAHVVLSPGAHGVEVARDVGKRLEGAIGSAHVTVQPEAATVSVLVSPASLTRPRGGE